MEPTNIPCLSKGISAGLRVDLDTAWALAREVQLVATDSAGGHRGDFVVGLPLVAAAVPS